MRWSSSINFVTSKYEYCSHVNLRLVFSKKAPIIQTQPAFTAIHRPARAAIYEHVVCWFQFTAMDATAPPAPLTVAHMDRLIHIVIRFDV